MASRPQSASADVAGSTDAYYRRLWTTLGEELTPAEQRRWRLLDRLIRRFAPGGERRRVLDYGCGSGRFLPLLAAHGSVDAFDVTPSVLETVRERYPGVTVIAGDGSFPTPVDDRAYDLVVSTEVLEHLVEQAAYLRDAHRVLRPGGVLVLTTPNGRFESDYKSRIRNLQPVENWRSAEELAELVRGAGFELLEAGTFAAHEANMPYRRGRLFRLLKKVGRRLGRRLWLGIEAMESRLAGRLGRGMVLYLAARRPAG